MSEAAAEQGSGGGGNNNGAGVRREGGNNSNSNNGGGRGDRGGAANGGRGGRGGNRGNNNNNNNNNKTRSKKQHKHSVKGMENYAFSTSDGGKAPAAYQLQDTKEVLIRHLRQQGEERVAQALEEMDPTQLDVALPAVPNATITVGEGQDAQVIENWEGKTRYGVEIKLALEERAKVQKAESKYFAIIFELCDLELRRHMENLAAWEGINQRKSVVELLQCITNVVYDAGDKKHQATTIVGLTRVFHQMNQGNTPPETWVKQRVALIRAIESLGGSVVSAPGLERKRAEELATAAGRVDADGNAQPNDADLAAGKTAARGEMEGALVLSGANSSNDAYKAHLNNLYAGGTNVYPVSAGGALEGMLTYVDPFELGRQAERRRDQLRNQQETSRAPRDGQDGLNFMQHRSQETDSPVDVVVEDPIEPIAPIIEEAAEVASAPPQQRRSYAQAVRDEPVVIKTDALVTPEEVSRLIQSGGTCVHCGGTHSLADCPNISTEDLERIYADMSSVDAGPRDGGMLLHGNKSARKGGLRSNYLYVDTCTTDNVMAMAQYLKDITTALKPLLLHTNGGSCNAGEHGYLGSIRFWLDRNAIANVISLTTLEMLFDEVSYNSRLHGGAFVCKNDDGKQVIFKRCPDTGFPYIDLDKELEDEAVVLIQTVRKNFEGFTRQEVEKAITARRLQATSGHPSEAVLKHEEKKCGASPTELTLSTSQSLNKCWS